MTGVHLRYHKPEEYAKLSKAQRKELDEWRRETKQGRYGNEKKRAAKNAKDDKAIAAAVEKQVEKKLKALQEEENQSSEMESFIMSCVEKFHKKDKTVRFSPNPTTVSNTNAKAVLQSIISRAKNNDQTKE